MKKKLFPIIRFLFFLGIGVLIVWLVLRPMGAEEYKEIKQAFLDANYLWIILSLILGVFSHISRAVRWQILLEPLGKKPSFWNTFVAVVISYIGNLAVPRLGEVLRCSYLKKYEGLPMNKTLGTVIAERVADTITLFSLFAFVIISQFSLLSSYATEKVFTPLSEKIGGVGSMPLVWIGGFVLILFFISSWFFFRKTHQPGSLVYKIKDLLKGFLEGLQTAKKIKHPGWFLFHSFFIWLMYFAMIWVAFNAMDETKHLGVIPGLASLVFGAFGMIAVQGGIGAYPVIIMETLELYNITRTVGFAFGWIIWTAQTLNMFLIGLITLILMPFMTKKIIK